jgi:hypothetical protein
MGVKDANAAIAKGHGGSLEDLIHYHAMKKTGNPAILKHTYGSFVEARAQGEFEDYDIHSDPYMAKYTMMQK